MIYLTRTLIDIDGTRMIETAVLEDSSHIKRYEAQGFVRCSYESFREAWRARHTQIFERLYATALANVPRVIEPVGVYAIPG